MNIIINVKKVLLITAIPLLFAASCNKNKTNPCVNAAYSFAVTSQWNPQREVYNIGDTIFLNSSFAKNLIDLVGNYNVDYSNSVGINGSITVYEFDSVQHQVLNAIEKFNFNQVIGSSNTNNLNPGRIRDFKFQEFANLYEFKIGVICKTKGLYAIYISNLESMGINGKNCTNASFVNTLSNTNKNINLFQYAMNRPPASQFEIDRIYCFRVQ